MALLSMVAFPGEVIDHRVVSLGDERRGPYRLASMRDRVQEAKDRRDEQFKLFSEFRRTNYDELLRIQRQVGDDPEKILEGRQGELQRQWTAFREEQKAVAASVHQRQQELEWEIRTVQKSLQREMPPGELEGETLTRTASVRVATKEGGEKPYLVVLTRYDLRNTFGAVVPTRWIVTAVEPAS